MNKVTKNVLIICGCVVVIGAGGTYFVQKSSAKPKTETATITYEVKKGDLSKTVTSSGNVEASNSVNLSFSGKSKVTKVNVNAGDKVQKGQLLAEMDATALQNALLSAQANYDSANAKLKSLQDGTDSDTIADQKYQVSKAKSDLDSAETDLANAKKLANPTYVQQQIDKAKAAVVNAQTKLDQTKQGTDQSQILFAQVALESAQNAYKQAASRQSGSQDSTQSSVTSAQSKADNAKRTYDQAVTQLNKLQKGPEASELAMAKASVAQAQASLSDAKANIQGAKIYAPFNGMVSAVNIKAGEYPAGDSTAVSMFSTEGNYKISASIDDTDITDVKVGQEVNITFDAMTGVTLKGKVTTKAVLGEIQSSGLVTFPVTVEITPGQDQADKLIPGLSATLAIITDGKKDVLSVPDAAIKSFGGRKIVMVDHNGTTEQKEITTGLDDGASTEVVSGLTEGDKVSITMTTSANKSSSSSMMQGGFGGIGGFGSGQMQGGREFNRSGGTTNRPSGTSTSNGGGR
ncbi:HlyD family efflux transporter periplasmic adaptor subunit [Paenibacillus sp. HJL G12]|uniref:HlyD family efflux transporter periplasmic adaptor subunit n=1 Tax=Paenibacillus dendrobii TaxID=2691084 RepID=A0A7X3LHF0_9BACL|nr:HlyD family efflux transporter periplasmic adaptor subunit [Paenibacillus dendrobii]MWV43159.1 HlyD family efflux transporter periplasmic adaptor subunit [Paenibacillus dendrobii]